MKITPERLFWFAAAAAIASLGLAADPVVRRLVQDDAPRPPDPAPQRAAEPPVSTDPILDLAPFGRVEPAPVPEAEAGETALELTLHGVVIAARPEASRAIVSGGAEPPQAYAPGERIAGIATLAAVDRDRIVLEVDGRRETLLFAEPAKQAGAGGSAPAPPRQPQARGLASGETAPSDTALAIADARERFQDNPYRVLDELGIEATQAGYRIGPSPAEAVLRAGLQPGDIVDKVNGQQVGNVELDRRFFGAVAATGQARVEVVRAGQRLVMSFPLQ